MHELIHSVFVVVPFLLVFFFLASGTGDVPDESSWHGTIYGVIFHNPPYYHILHSIRQPRMSHTVRMRGPTEVPDDFSIISRMVLYHTQHHKIHHIFYLSRVERIHYGSALWHSKFKTLQDAFLQDSADPIKTICVNHVDIFCDGFVTCC